ncbi:MAG: hypothetical protein JST79_15755 [Acidobacteria bacterium]|jgi:hypothetical protein|nr:hypothetical protein [Acidobacteriota bacterium]
MPSEVVLYFEKQEDALSFTLATSSVLSEENSVRRPEALTKLAQEIRKASRITTQDVVATPMETQAAQDLCA